MQATIVSIVLPTYNRARFLPEAFASISAQRFADWELVVVDDGSSDDTRELVQKFAESVPQTVRYLKQTNQGFYAARNVGVGEASGKYLAFFDSDDLWLDHHLKNCADALEGHSDVDWVFSASRIETLATKEVRDPNSFYDGTTPRPFMSLRHRQAGALRIIADERFAECALGGGLNCGLQGSVVRRAVFAPLCPSATNPRDISVDQYIVMRAAASGIRFAYFDDVHVIYRVHDDNCSAANVALDVDRQIGIYRDQVDGLLQLRNELPLTPRQARRVRRRIAGICFWQLGYASFWQNQRPAEALTAFRKAISMWLWDWRCWKTYLLCALRYQLSRANPIKFNAIESTNCEPDKEAAINQRPSFQ